MVEHGSHQKHCYELIGMIVPLTLCLGSAMHFAGFDSIVCRPLELAVEGKHRVSHPPVCRSRRLCLGTLSTHLQWDVQLRQYE